jgi:threonine synthase
MSHQECINCGTKYPTDEILYFCRKCGDILEIKLDYDLTKDMLKKSDWKKTPLSVWRYRDLMPITDPTRIVTLGEGGTGLHPCKRLGKALGLKELYVKNEGENPTGSFKESRGAWR